MKTNLENFLSKQTSLIIQAKFNLAYFARLIWPLSFPAMPLKIVSKTWIFSKIDDMR